MKNKLFILASIVFASVIMLTACNMQDNKGVKSQEKIQNAKEFFADVTCC
jgi:hypothetical protein